MPESHAQRRASLRTSLRSREIDALLVTDLRNVRYLTGFTGSNAALLVHAAGESDTMFCTDGRYVDQAAAEVPDLFRMTARPSDAALATHAAQLPGRHRRVGFESQHVTVDGLDELTESAAGVQLVRSPGLVEQLRLIKDEAEIEMLRTACAAADHALADLLQHGGLRPGRTEREVARELETRMADHGAAGPSFDTIVATGEHSAIPHHRPTDAPLAPGDFVKMDFGALVNGYHSDMTRTVVLGAPADWQRELYELVRAAQEAGRRALAIGAELRDVDEAARAVIREAGRADMFTHGLGHGVGLEIHEAPALSPRGHGKIAAGMAVTVEPGVYLAGRGGVRIEDTLAVRPNTPELLTLTQKELLAV